MDRLAFDSDGVKHARELRLPEPLKSGTRFEALSGVAEAKTGSR
jgi:hypothetical protein